ncbi:MAG TPA: GIY-YIG nuclease family protein [Alphaproteobacteria bacterium]|nr:GIY-YIG nuclease family protein [Alphaproteobacteria bacterium]
MSGWVSIMTNKPSGILYVGVTGSLRHRAWQHRTGALSGFTRKYGLKRLVFTEEHQTIQGAIRRQRVIKGWPRAWKVRLIVENNPDWADLYDQLV